MSAYVKATNFATKDTLPTGDANKIVKGTEIDNEFNSIAGAVSSKADLASPAFTGTPTVPTATAGTNTTQIANCAFVLTNGVPSGVITMWSGTIATIPSGWYLCNGSNGTPDLRDKFVIGAKQDDSSVAKTNVTGSLTQTGGSKDAVNVSHSHTATSSVSDPGHSHLYGAAGFNGGQFATGGAPTGYGYTASAGTGISVSTSISTEGSSGTNANLPPYFALAFIMKA